MMFMPWLLLLNVRRVGARKVRLSPLFYPMVFAERRKPTAIHLPTSRKWVQLSPKEAAQICSLDPQGFGDSVLAVFEGRAKNDSLSSTPVEHIVVLSSNDTDRD